MRKLKLFIFWHLKVADVGLHYYLIVPLSWFYFKFQITKIQLPKFKPNLDLAFLFQACSKEKYSMNFSKHNDGNLWRMSNMHSGMNFGLNLTRMEEEFLIRISLIWMDIHIF